MDADHLDFLLAECDSNYDDSLCAVEIFDCMMLVENDWRAENCPEGYP